MYYNGNYATMQDMDVRGFLPMRRIVNIFGAIGYSLLIFVYAITLGVVMMWLVNGGHLEFIGVSPADAQVIYVTSSEAAQPSFAWQVFAYVLTVVMAMIVLFVMVTLPYWLGRSSSRILKRAIRYCQQPVTLASLLAGKVLACGIGAVPIIIGGLYLKASISIVIVLLGVVSLALFVFLIQHYLARMSEVVAAKDVW